MSMHGLQGRVDKLEAQQKGSGLHTVILHSDGSCTNNVTGEEYPDEEAAAQALQDGKLIVFIRQFGERRKEPREIVEEARQWGKTDQAAFYAGTMAANVAGQQIQ